MIELLLSRPDLPEDAVPYYAAFQLLKRDRPTESISMGMAGGVSRPLPVPREAIIREGERRGLEGDELEDFIEAVLQIDDFDIETQTKRLAAEVKASANRANRPSR